MVGNLSSHLVRFGHGLWLGPSPTIVDTRPHPIVVETPWCEPNSYNCILYTLGCSWTGSLLLLRYTTYILQNTSREQVLSSINKCILVLTNILCRSLRYSAYRVCSWILFGKLGRRRRRRLPDCLGINFIRKKMWALYFQLKWSETHSQNQVVCT